MSNVIYPPHTIASPKIVNRWSHLHNSTAAVPKNKLLNNINLPPIIRNNGKLAKGLKHFVTYTNSLKTEIFGELGFEFDNGWWMIVNFCKRRMVYELESVRLGVSELDFVGFKDQVYEDGISDNSGLVIFKPIESKQFTYLSQVLSYADIVHYWKYPDGKVIEGMIASNLIEIEFQRKGN